MGQLHFPFLFLININQFNPQFHQIWFWHNYNGFNETSVFADLPGKKKNYNLKTILKS